LSGVHYVILNKAHFAAAFRTGKRTTHTQWGLQQTMSPIIQQH